VDSGSCPRAFFGISSLALHRFPVATADRHFLRSFSGKMVFVLQGALVGGLTSLVFVGWLVIGAQTEIARGAIKFQWKPMSTEGCMGNLTDHISPLSAADDRYCGHCYSHTVCRMVGGYQRFRRIYYLHLQGGDLYETLIKPSRITYSAPQTVYFIMRY